MKIIRVFAGDDGESHFEEVPFAEMQGVVDRVGPGDININRREAPNFSDYHIAPRRQYVVNLEGIAEFECADGSKVQMEPGDILVAEDLSGHGHIARSPSPGCAPRWPSPSPSPSNQATSQGLHKRRGGFETRPCHRFPRPRSRSSLAPQ